MDQTLPQLQCLFSFSQNGLNRIVKAIGSEAFSFVVNGCHFETQSRNRSSFLLQLNFTFQQVPFVKAFLTLVICWKVELLVISWKVELLVIDWNVELLANRRGSERKVIVVVQDRPIGLWFRIISALFGAHSFQTDVNGRRRCLPDR
jgi:hypothetical protein